MQRIYLDQNKWVDLARARTGHPEGAKFVEAYEVLKAAGAAGTASCPLSGAHYFETHKQGDPQKRMDLAKTMLEISGLDAIAPPHVIVPYEIEVALIETFGLDRPTPAIEIFGQGANHVHGTEMFAYALPDEVDRVSISADQRQFLTAAGQAALEILTLADYPTGSDVRMKLNDHTRLNGDKFVKGQNDVRDSLDQIGRHRLGDMMIATAVTDILDLLLATCQRLEVDPNPLFDGGATTLGPFLEAMPSRWVEMQLRRVRQSNPQKAWEGNDLNDVSALSIAIPYCDIVVTEKSWTGMINTRKINRPFGTVVVRDLRDLPTLLRSAAA
ncbi:hypothetical protein SAMN05444157_1330 [Frankineae bacterium MT45]|nr:hypothetical protein SAMN05444157_1330 [Frankineae bacterium MT45]